MGGCISVYVTTATAAEAEQLGRTLVEERLAACANVIDGLTSIYRWEGETRRDREAAVLLKTRAELLPRAEARIRELHGYDTPCVVAWPIVGGNEAYLAWIREQTLEASPGS